MVVRASEVIILDDDNNDDVQIVGFSVCKPSPPSREPSREPYREPYLKPCNGLSRDTTSSSTKQAHDPSWADEQNPSGL